MDNAAYQQYYFESENWLKVGRCNLLARLICAAMYDQTDLEVLNLRAGVGQNISALCQFGSVDTLEKNELRLTALRKNSQIREIIDQLILVGLDRKYVAIMKPYPSVKKCGYFISILFPAAATIHLVTRLRYKGNTAKEARKHNIVVPGLVDAVFRFILSCEIKMIERRLGLPFGLSVYCLALRQA